MDPCTVQGHTFNVFFPGGVCCDSKNFGQDNPWTTKALEISGLWQLSTPTLPGVPAPPPPVGPSCLLFPSQSLRSPHHLKCRAQVPCGSCLGPFLQGALRAGPTSQPSLLAYQPFLFNPNRPPTTPSLSTSLFMELLIPSPCVSKCP
jgi:hypothetical protein